MKHVAGAGCGGAGANGFTPLSIANTLSYILKNPKIIESLNGLVERNV